MNRKMKLVRMVCTGLPAYTHRENGAPGIAIFPNVLHWCREVEQGFAAAHQGRRDGQGDDEDPGHSEPVRAMYNCILIDLGFVKPGSI